MNESTVMAALKCQNCGRPAHDQGAIRAAYRAFSDFCNQPDATRQSVRDAGDRYFALVRSYCEAAPTSCLFEGCVSTDRHWHGPFPGGYENPNDPDGPPIPFTSEPAPGVRDYNGALLKEAN